MSALAARLSAGVEVAPARRVSDRRFSVLLRSIWRSEDLSLHRLPSGLASVHVPREKLVIGLANGALTASRFCRVVLAGNIIESARAQGGRTAPSFCASRPRSSPPRAASHSSIDLEFGREVFESGCRLVSGLEGTMERVLESLRRPVDENVGRIHRLNRIRETYRSYEEMLRGDNKMQIDTVIRPRATRCAASCSGS